MTEQKHLKALIRARMARTGESYTSARSHIVARAVPPTARLAAEFRAHDKHYMTAAFTPDDAHLISGGFGGQAGIWTTDGTLAGELVGHEAAVSVYASRRTGRRSLSRSPPSISTRTVSACGAAVTTESFSAGALRLKSSKLPSTSERRWGRLPSVGLTASWRPL